MHKFYNRWSTLTKEELDRILDDAFAAAMKRFFEEKRNAKG